MEKYRRRPKCLKCGSGELHFEYRIGGRGSTKEQIALICRQCGYGFSMECKDSPKEGPKPLFEQGVEHGPGPP